MATQGASAGNIYPLESETITIGRDPSNAIALVGDATVSRRHATVARTGNVFIIRDEGSSNGTFVNGVKITEKTLSPGDEIQIGTTKLRFES